MDQQNAFFSLNKLNKLGEKSASIWSLLRKYTMMHGPQNVKPENLSHFSYVYSFEFLYYRIGQNFYRKRSTTYTYSM